MERQKRIEALGQRFIRPTDTQGKKTVTSSESNRRHHSIYIDEGLMDQVDFVYKEFRHQAYPKEITKSVFLEQLLQRGLQDLDGVKSSILDETA
jgi:hypothetical protein